jgi:hypothetical protein
MNETFRELGGNDGREEFTLTANTLPGDLVFTGDGLAAVTKHSNNGISGDPVAVATDELVLLDADSATTFTARAAVWWNPTTKRAVPEGTTGARPAGLCVVAKTNGQVTVLVRLNASIRMGTGIMAASRVFTAAEVNAGAELLPAIPGYAYRMYGAKATAIGGNAAGATTVDILGTQTTAAKLVAHAVAALTQNTPVADGSANVLAAGASYAQNDVNTAITVGKTGASLTGSTSVLVQFLYTLVAA